MTAHSMGEHVTDDVDRLADEFQDFRLRSEPLWGHMIGDYRYADRFIDASRGAEDQQIAELRALCRRAEKIDETQLDPQHRITRSMMIWEAEARAARLESRDAEFAVDPIFGVQASIRVVMPKLAMPDATVAEAMHDKIRGAGTYFRDLAERHREGVASGRTPADFAVRQTIEQLDAWLATPIADDPILNTAALPDGVDAQEWRAELTRVVEDEVRPALGRYRDVLRDEVAPAARPDDRCGLTWLADGAEVYARDARYYTTVDLSPQQIHDIGLQQVESLAREYRVLGKEVLGTEDVPSILEAMRSNPALHHHSADQIVADSKAAMAKARAAMRDWFGILPQADCDVEPTTSGAIAYYFAPPKDRSRGGVFFMNVSEPQAWGRFQIEATAYHEGIPGHHLQLAIASELEGLPEFRTRAMLAAYAEGWGLYTERLADEMGIYSSPLDRMGMLSADSMRACRLVVDTGMHALGWSRDQAIDYMVANSPMQRAHVAAEIDRYAVTPGQALAYMIGRLEIQRIRREAEQRLGDRFDIKRFHDVVLGSGPLPLKTLDELVTSSLT
jgi:uncharacterized protein (DUF885 family)